VTPEERAEKLSAFLAEQRLKPETYNVDVFGDGGLDGDDVAAFLLAFSKRFGVDLEGCRLYFHQQAEGGFGNIGAIFFKPPYMRVPHIPVTFETLARAVEIGKWPIEYPPHKIPKYRWDLTINQIVVAAIVVGIIAISIWK
jgi:hypothetical protein